MIQMSTPEECGRRDKVTHRLWDTEEHELNLWIVSNGVPVELAVFDIENRFYRNRTLDPLLIPVRMALS